VLWSNIESPLPLRKYHSQSDGNLLSLINSNPGRGVQMNKILISGMALAAMIAGPAMAADMPVKAPPPVPVFSWTGCYIGIQGG
jgi:hypothetical protein